MKRVEIKVNPKYARLEQWLRRLPDYRFDEKDVIKRGRNTLFRARWLGVDMVVKRFDRITLANRLIYHNIRPTKARRSYDNAIRLMNAEFLSPEPVGYVDVMRNGVLQQSYYVCLWQEGTVVDEWWRRADARDVAYDLAYMLLSMHEQGICHRDLNAGNIICGKFGEYYLVDVNRIRWNCRSERLHLRNFRQLCNNECAMEYLALAYADLRGDANPYTFRNRVVDAREHDDRWRQVLHGLKRLVSWAYPLMLRELKGGLAGKNVSYSVE